MKLEGADESAPLASVAIPAHLGRFTAKQSPHESFADYEISLHKFVAHHETPFMGSRHRPGVLGRRGHSLVRDQQHSKTCRITNYR